MQHEAVHETSRVSARQGAGRLQPGRTAERDLARGQKEPGAGWEDKGGVRGVITRQRRRLGVWSRGAREGTAGAEIRGESWALGGRPGSPPKAGGWAGSLEGGMS